jgi:putative transcriptional regulator
LKTAETASFFERLKSGLEASIAHSRGELTLRTTTLPARPPAASARKVRTLRRKLGMSQQIFAATLNVSTKLVQSWEQGLRKPDRAALRLLQIIEAHPHLFTGEAEPKRRAPRRAAKAVA